MLRHVRNPRENEILARLRSMVEESKPDGKGTDETDPYASVPFFTRIFGDHAVSQDRSMRPGPTSLLAGDGRARMTSETCCASLTSAPGNPGD